MESAARSRCWAPRPTANSAMARSTGRRSRRLSNSMRFDQFVLREPAPGLGRSSGRRIDRTDTCSRAATRQWRFREERADCSAMWMVGRCGIDQHVCVEGVHRGSLPQRCARSARSAAAVRLALGGGQALEICSGRSAPISAVRPPHRRLQMHGPPGGSAVRLGEPSRQPAFHGGSRSPRHHAPPHRSTLEVRHVQRSR